MNNEGDTPLDLAQDDDDEIAAMIREQIEKKGQSARVQSAEFTEREAVDYSLWFSA